MSYYGSYRRTVNCKWGELFGISAADLTEDQLKQITTDKLVELVGQDPRVEKILGDRLLTCNINDLREINRLETGEMERLPYLHSQYNDVVVFRDAEIEKASTENYYRYQRKEYIFWNFLNSSNKAKEISRWIDSKDSMVDLAGLDYSWLFKNYEWLGHQAVKKILKEERGSYRARREVRKATQVMIAALQPEHLERHIEDIFACQKSVHAHALSNPHMPSKYVIKGLRSIAGRKNLPSINIKLTKQQLESLPPVMRLEVLESIMVHSYGRVEFDDILTEDAMKALLFSCAIKHNNRVSEVVQRFNSLLKRQLAQADKGV